MRRLAFTLVEVIIVIAVIGILATISVSHFSNARVMAQISRVQEDLETLSKALIMYQTDNAAVPLSVDLKSGLITPHFVRLRPLTTPVAYMGALPMDIFRPELPPSYLEKYGWEKTGHYAFDFIGGLDINFFRAHSWILSSVGPAVSRPDMSNGYGEEDIYNISNGLYSSGSIIDAY